MATLIVAVFILLFAIFSNSENNKYVDLLYFPETARQTESNEVPEETPNPGELEVGPVTDFNEDSFGSPAEFAKSVYDQL